MRVTARRGRSGRDGGQSLLTILFTDIESSTALTQRLGDARAQEIMRAHNAIVRREVAARGGTAVKHTGDGIMATFPSAARAVACAVAVQQEAQTYRDQHPENAFSVCIGLNAGEPVAEDADVFGSAVQLAARTCSEAKGGQILATNVVRELVFGKGYLFMEAGSRELKGFDGPIRLYEVEGAEGALDDSAVETGIAALFRRPIALVVAGVVALAALGGIAAAAIAFSGVLDSNDATVAYRAFRYNVDAEGPVQVTAGDCVATDTVIAGTLTATLAGDISGTGEVMFEARLPAQDRCTTLVATIESDNTVAGGSFTEYATSVSLRRLGDAPLEGSATDAISAGIVVGQGGVYEGTVGKDTCRVTGLSRFTQEGVIASTSGECTAEFAQSTSAVPIIVQAVGTPLEIAPPLSSGGGSDTAKVIAVIRNNSGAPLSGVALRLPPARGGEVASRLTADDPWVNGERTFQIGKLAPGELTTIEFTVRLLAAQQDTLTLIPEITAARLDFVDRSDPIVFTIVS